MLPAPAPAAESVAAPGSLIGGCFRVQSLLGQGGVASVYRVCDERSGRQLALKQLSRTAGLNAAVIHSQFEREYHTLSQLAHPRIVSVYDYGVDNGTPFYTMELIDGTDLSTRQKRSWQEVCVLLCDVASALALIHSRRLVHRDVSLHNVRCTADGRAKLIDFGALAPMGTVKQVIGTPPFVSPEALRLQALDGRADLYALGVLAYFMLTGYYPYHARSLAQLKTIWRSAPYPPSRYHPDLPEALDSLVMELLELDRDARPPTVAEAIERLSGIAGLSLQDLPEVRQAYLTAPVLVGRESLLDAARSALSEAQQGRGTTLLIEGPAGMGRSRALDACVLEAKLQGTLLLRGDSGDSGEDYGLVRALCMQLLQQAPELFDQSAAPWATLLAHVLPVLAETTGEGAQRPDRPQLQAALCDFIAAVAHQRPLVIAVDDLDKIDEVSAAWLAGLALRQKSLAICVLGTLQTGTAISPALQLLEQAASTQQLAALDATQTEALLRSVFGDAAHVAGMADRVHRVCEGNPGWTMTVAEQLVEHGQARYEAGGWALPTELKLGMLAQYLGNALWRRVASLPADARELAEALSLTDTALLNLADYRLLTAHGDAGRVYEAVDALVAARILIPEGSRYRFVQQGLRELLQNGQSPEHAFALHGRLAAVLAHGSHPLQLAYHLMRGGSERAAIEHLLPLATARASAVMSDFEVELVERAVEAANRLALPRPQQLALRESLLRAAGPRGLPAARHYGLLLIEQYERDSGLWDYRTLELLSEPGQRIERAIETAAQRHAATPEHERGVPPADAMAHLAQAHLQVVSLAAITQDLALLESLPSLLPLCEISPQLATVQLYVELQRGSLTGRYDAIIARCQEVLRRLEQPDRAGFDDVVAQRFRFGILLIMGLFAAGGGMPEAREWVAELQRLPGYRSHAWRARMVYELMRGNQEAATVCQRRAELLNLQDSGQTIFPGLTIRIELLAAIYADDLLAVKRLSEQLEPLAARYPAWLPSLALARSHYRRLQGDAEGGLKELAPALAHTHPERHADWAMVVSTEVALLVALGRADEATTTGLRYVALCQQANQRSSYCNLLRYVAEAALSAQRVDDAFRLMDACVPYHEGYGPQGLALGLTYEARARVAIAQGDQAALQHYYDLSAEQLKGLPEGARLRRYERLLQEAEQVDLQLVRKAQPAGLPPRLFSTHAPAAMQRAD